MELKIDKNLVCDICGADVLQGQGQFRENGLTRDTSFFSCSRPGCRYAVPHMDVMTVDEQLPYWVKVKDLDIPIDYEE